jgi:hypothetical protein
VDLTNDDGKTPWDEVWIFLNNTSLFYMQLLLSNVTSRVFFSFFSVATAVGDTMSLFECECSSPILLFDERLCFVLC